MQREIENSINLITAGFESYEDKIKDMMRGYSLINTPIIDADDIGNWFDHLERIISIRLVPAAFVKGEIEVDKVMPYQKQQFIASLQNIAIFYRGWKTIDTYHFRDLLLDYFMIQNDAQTRETLKATHNIEFVLTSTLNYHNNSNAKMDILGATNLNERDLGSPEDDILMQIKEAETHGDDEKARILRNIHMLNTELDITVDYEETQRLSRRINILTRRLNEFNSSPSLFKHIKLNKKNIDGSSSPKSLERQRNKDLREIFEFYAKQHLMIGKRATFDMIKHQNSIINMGDFILFCKDFKIPLDKRRWAKVYKLNASHSNEMDLSQFDISMPKLFVESNKEELEKLQNRWNEIKKIYKSKKKNFIESIKGTDTLVRLIQEIIKAKIEHNEKVKLETQEKDSKDILIQAKDNNLEQEQSNMIEQDQSVDAPSNDNPIDNPKEPFKAIGGNPMNPQVSLQKQVEAEKKYLEEQEKLKADAYKDTSPIKSREKIVSSASNEVPSQTASKTDIPDTENMNENER